MKKILSVVGVIGLIILIVPVFLPSHFSMSRSIQIEKPISAVFSNLTDLNIYAKWNPFAEGDPTNKTEVSGVGEGSFLVWKGEKTGEGKMTITQVETDKKISIRMDFIKPMPGEGAVAWLTNSKSDSATELVWSFEQELPYFSRYFGLIMDSMIGKPYEKGLANFKEMLESAKLAQ